MFSTPLAIVSYAAIDGRLHLLTAVAEFDPRRQTPEDFARHFTENYARAGDESFGYRLVERNAMGIVRDYYTKERLGFGTEGSGPHDGADHR